jgi:hypothetical protein
MLRLVQIIHPEKGRHIARVDSDTCTLIDRHTTIHGLASYVLLHDKQIVKEVEENLCQAKFDYDELYSGSSEWRLLSAYDHPGEAARCLVAGTGLTHKASVDNRQAMHEQEDDAEPEITDSMKIYQWGLEGGKPASGTIGVPPEWFYKGCGTILRSHGEDLEVPSFAGDGGEEPEIAGAYIIDPDGNPRRIGLTIGNEFSDHVTEKKNYLYLAPSKLRHCSLGPELIVQGDFEDVKGTVSIERNGEVTWSKSISTGETNMSHHVANLEHHHFKYDAHRMPGDAHVYFFGADAFSYGDGLSLEDGDVMVIEWEGFGRPLRNPIRINDGEDRFVAAEPM